MRFRQFAILSVTSFLSGCGSTTFDGKKTVSSQDKSADSRGSSENPQEVGSAPSSGRSIKRDGVSNSAPSSVGPKNAQAQAAAESSGALPLPAEVKSAIDKLPLDKQAQAKKGYLDCVVAFGAELPAAAKNSAPLIQFASVSVGSSAVLFSDTVQTEQPRLAILFAGVNVGGKPVYEMLNDNGYYCVVSTVAVGSAPQYRLGCRSHLTSPVVGVSVGGNGKTVGAVGVSVGSNTSVERVACPAQ
jgi:hypothetical protein